MNRADNRVSVPLTGRTWPCTLYRAALYRPALYRPVQDSVQHGALSPGTKPGVLEPTGIKLRRQLGKANSDVHAIQGRRAIKCPSHRATPRKRDS